MIRRRVRLTPPRMLPVMLAVLATVQVACSPNPAQPIDGEVWYMGFGDPERPTLFMYSLGSGEPVLVLHGGFGAEHSYLIDLVQPLATEHHFVLFDQRGSLRSPAADSLISFQYLLDDIEWIREELGVERLTLLGHSMGTRLAMAYADAHPHRVERLVLVSSLPPAIQIPEGVLPSETPPLSFHLAGPYLRNRPVLQDLMREHGLVPEDGQRVTDLSHLQRSRRFRMQFAADNVYDVSKWRQVKGGVAYFSSHASQLLSSGTSQFYDYLTSLRSGEFPVTVINGDHDFANFTALSYEELYRRVMPDEDPLPDDAVALAKRVVPPWGDHVEGWPRLEVQVLENAGHNPWIDQPEEMTRLLKRALARE